MLEESNKAIIERLIQASAMFFVNDENTLILDSTWLGKGMYMPSSHIKGRLRQNDPSSLGKCRKLHIACLKNSKVITCAKATAGTVNDSPLFEELVRTTVKNGFHIHSCLADAGYMAKRNYALCEELSIRDVFIDFKSNVEPRRGKCKMWKARLRMFREQPELWHESYRFRQCIEGVFASSKRKHMNYVRSLKACAQDMELLLKALVHNLETIGRYI